MSERRFNPANRAKLDNPERRRALPPEQLLQMLNIKANEDILDLGAGTGYFTIPAAQITNGSVYALDVSPQMLEVIRDQANEQNLRNIKLVEGVIEHIPLEDNAVDHVIASFVLHEVELSISLGEIRRVLREGGLCFCLEWEMKEEDKGPPLDHRIHSDELKKAFVQHGFTVEKQTSPTDSHYILIIRK
jgi:ubiquinone/menaquinone biosynthesis C-methylase UbiE